MIWKVRYIFLQRIGRAITAEYENFYLVGVYVPNAGDGLVRLDYRCKEWNVDFQNYLNKLKEKKHVILTGDQNVCHKALDIFDGKARDRMAGCTPEEKKGMDNLLEDGWIDTFRDLYPEKKQYSWWSYRFGARAQNKGWRLDYFVVNKSAMSAVKDSLIIDKQVGSDHCPVELELEVSKLSEKTDVKTDDTEENKVNGEIEVQIDTKKDENSEEKSVKNPEEAS